MKIGDGEIDNLEWTIKQGGVHGQDALKRLRDWLADGSIELTADERKRIQDISGREAPRTAEK